MPMPVWNESLATGLDLLDRQHQDLFGALHGLHAALDGGRGMEEARACLDRLSRYTVEHFDAEEAAMRQMGYPRFTSHRMQHGLLAGQVQGMVVRMDAGGLPTAEVVRFLTGWLATHIQDLDLDFARYARSRVPGAGGPG